ncbi:MAG: hypothetical protein V7749_00720 [Cocleimonas sp.]
MKTVLAKSKSNFEKKFRANNSLYLVHLITLSKKRESKCMKVFLLTVAMLSTSVFLMGCQSRLANSEFLSMNELRPAVVIKYDYPLQSATNNVESLREAIEASPAGLRFAPTERQTVIVSNIGEGGEAIALERAKKSAFLAEKAGEVSPRLYIRNGDMDWQGDKVEVFVFPKEKWSDSAFLYAMTSESFIVQPLGGVIKSEIARLGMDQVLERKIHIQEANLSVSLESALKSVGWGFEGYAIPAIKVESATIAVAISEAGKASPMEASEIAKVIINLTQLNSLDVRANVRRGVIEIYGNDND